LKKLGILTVMLLSLLLLPGLPGQTEVVDRIVAFVNGDIITLRELDSAFEPYRTRIDDTYQGPDKGKVVADAKRSLLNRMIENLLINQEAQKSAITIQDEEIMASIGEMLSQKKMTMEDFKKSLAREGTSFEDYKKEVRDSLLRMRVLRKEVRSRIAVSDEEIGEYYRLHRDDYEGVDAVRLKQILLLFSKSMDADAKAGLQAEALDILRQLRAGASFDALAARFSQGPAAEAGGDVGYVEKGAMLPEVEKAAYSLKKNQISDLIESSVGFHIIKVIDRRGGGVKSMEDVRAEIKSRLENEKLDKKYDSWVSELREKSLVDIRL